MSVPSFAGVAFIFAAGYWFGASLVPLIGGLLVRRSERLSEHWPQSTIRLVAAFILKPVFTTAIYLWLYLSLDLDGNWLRAALVLAVLGPGVTIGLLYRFRAGIAALPRTALMLLLVLDATRWITSFLNAVGFDYAFGSGPDSTLGMPIPFAVIVPTLVTPAAWLLLARGRPAADPAHRRDPHHLGPALLGTSAIVALVLLSSGYSALADARRFAERDAATPGDALQVFAKHEIDVLSWSPDGAYIAAGDATGAVHVVDPVRDAQQFIFDTPSARIDGLAWSPRGDVIAIQLPTAIQFIDAQTGAELRTIQVTDAPFIKDPDVVITNYLWAEIAWSRDGRYLAADSDAALLILDPHDQQADRSIVVDAAVYSLSWSPDGRYLAAGVDDDVLIWEVATGSVARYGERFIIMPHVAWSPDGAWLAVHGWYEPDLRLYDTATFTERRLPLDREAGMLYTAWNPNGDRLAVETKDGAIAIWDPVAAAPVHDFRGTVGSGSTSPLAWSGDGRYLAATTGRGIWIWDDQLNTAQRLDFPSYIQEPIWHPAKPWFVTIPGFYEPGLRLVRLES